MKLKKILKSKTVKILLLIIAVISAIFAYYEITAKRDTRVKASGTVEVKEIQVAPLIGGRITALNFDEADSVKKGEIVLQLSLDGADHDVTMAEAAYEAARQKYIEAQNGARAEDISSAEAQYRLREIQYEQAKKDSIRFGNLSKEGVISKREYELYKQKADAEKQAMEISKETLSKLKNGVRIEELKQALAGVKRAEAALAKAKTVLEYKTLVSPTDGIVLTKNYEVGDVIGTGTPVITLGKMDEPWIKLYIPSTQLGLIKLGGEAEVKVDSHPQKVFKAKVTEVNQKAEYNPRLSLTQKERANMVFWIKVSVEDKDGILKPGMPADVIIL
ncbi:MAG: efflux RND transporter periplasmic adaptor subunit [Synergistaceae bacterium]